MNIRTYAALAAATISAFAYSADMMYYLGYGNTSFASLNGKAVGDELKSVSAIGNIGNTVTVSIFGKSTSSSTLQYGGGCMFVGFDTATTNNNTLGYANRAAAEAAGTSKMIQLSETYSSFGTFHGSKEDGTIKTIGDPRFRGAAQAGSSDTLRSIGVNQAFTFGLGNNIVIDGGQIVRIADLLITNVNIVNGQVFGDSDAENGLTLNSIDHVSSGAMFMGNQVGGNPGVGKKYSLMSSVPESSTWLAIGAGFGLLLIRRRRK